MNLLYKDVLLVGFVMSVAELLKLVGFPKKFIPVANMVVGITLGTILVNPTNLIDGIFQGSVIGLTASGVFTSGKNVYEGLNK